MGTFSRLARLTDRGLAADDPLVDDDIDPREAARTKRRDHDATAEERDLLRPGMGKVFKQIQDAQRKAASETPRRRRGGMPG
jgi:hypothetical protein